MVLHMNDTKRYDILGATKSSLLWGDEGWVYISGEPVRDDDPRQYYKIVPTLFRGVSKRANAISTLPWALVQGETDYDTSEDYQNKAGLVKNMSQMLYLIEFSLVMSGRAYWKREKNPAGYDKLRHLDPTSLQLDEKRAVNGELVWKRYENNVVREYTTKEIIYLWYPDPYVEIGPPDAWPVKTALMACGVLANIDEFAKAYFERGAIKATLFSMSGASRQTAEEFETWWKRFINGIKNVFTTKVINADKVEPIVVGEGIKELAETTVAPEKREEIAQALDIPMSLLFANAANYATAERDKLNWYEDTIVPESKLIASILNDQIFTDLGLRFEFRHETLSIFQEDEKERSMALGYLFNAEVPLDIAMRILGFDLDEEQWKRIEEQVREKEEQAEELVGQLTDNQNQGAAVQPEDPKDKPDPFQEKGVDMQAIGSELGRWQSKCISAVKRGETASSVDFIPVAIPADVFERVSDGLKEAATDTDVKDVFVGAMLEPAEPTTAPANDALMLIMQEIRDMKTATIWRGYP